MLSTSTIKKIAQITRIKEEDIVNAIKSEDEVELQVSDLHVFDDEELKSLGSNKYNEGKKAGVEMSVDDQKKKLGLDFTGKTLDGLLENFKKHIINEAGINPDTRVKELSKDLETMRKEYESLKGVLAQKEGEALKAMTDRELFTQVPETTLAPADLVDFARVKGYDFKLENGKVVAYKNGEVLKNKVAEPLSPKEVLEGFAKDFKLIKEESHVPGGRGAGNVPPANVPLTLKELKEQFESQGKSVLGEDFMKAVEQAAKNPDFQLSA